jgi:hypothetical protein
MSDRRRAEKVRESAEMLGKLMERLRGDPTARIRERFRRAFPDGFEREEEFIDLDIQTLEDGFQELWGDCERIRRNMLRLAERMEE